MIKKVILIAVVLVVGGLLTVPILQMYQSYQYEKAIDESLGEGQRYVDQNYKRCLLKDVRSDGTCPPTSKGYNPNTGKYDTGASGMADVNSGIYGYTDPYDPQGSIADSWIQP